MNQNSVKPASDAYESQILDLRLDILNRAAIPLLFMVGLLGMALTPFETSQTPKLMVYASILTLSILCGLLTWYGRHRLPLWVCAWGALALSMALVIAGNGEVSALWAGLACGLMVILIGGRSGWAAVGVLGASLGLYTLARPALAPISQAGATVLMAGITVFILSSAGRLLLNTLNWMSEGYALAFQQSDELRNKSAELEGAFKSLAHTSSALARANEQLEIMVKFAEDARRSKQEFAANISHELRTPLNLIIGFSDVILNAPATYYAERLSPKLLADIQTIHRNADHLSALVNDILDLSQMDTNYMTILREPVHFEEFMRSALDDFRPLAVRRGLALHLHLAPGLPEIYADRTRIRQVLLNLLANALRFTDHGAITVQVTEMNDPVTLVSADKPAAIATPAGTMDTRPSYVVISVSDTGAGIAPGDLQRIFEPFTQADNSKRRKHAGSGLGLTISKRFVELHGGQMWVQSAPGQGSIFSFSLPITPPAPAIGIESTPQQVHRYEVGTLAVVDQNDSLSRMLERYLEGISIAHVSSVAQLPKLIDTDCPEIVLINQPAETAHLPAPWPAELKHTPVMQCHMAGATERILASITQRAPDAGTADANSAARRYFLPKPVTREQLYQTLQHMLERPALLASASATAAPPAPVRILVVEDDVDTLRLFGRMLRLAPLEIELPCSTIVPVEAQSGEEALELLCAPDGALIDGVLLDMQLGAISGFDVLRAMEQEQKLREIPVCMITGGELRDEPMTTPYLGLTRADGLTTSELLQAIAAILPIVVPGIDVRASQPHAAPQSVGQP
jgi:signal transduction histidine kinase/CheY-like chemotaxis protein